MTTLVRASSNLLDQTRINSWSNELVVRQLLAGKKMSMEAEDIFVICHQATTGEDTAG
jgi:hypothetical protein